MSAMSRPLLDSNILIYAANRDSCFYRQALQVLEEYLPQGVCLVDLCLEEFFQVITDGRKTARPFTSQQALEYIQRLTELPTVAILQAASLADIAQDRNKTEETVRYRLSRFHLYNYLIADCMRSHGVETIITGNAEDFLQFDFLRVFNPFAGRPTAGHKTVLPVLPYGRQVIDEQDTAAVCSVLRSDWLTTGPKVGEFEEAVANFCGAGQAVALSSGTAALHAAMAALDIGPGDEVIVPAITFVATANCVVYQGGTPVFADVEPDTLLIDPVDVVRKITPRTKAIIAVDYAGQPCDYTTLRRIADQHDLALVADACHSIGAEYRGRKVGTLADCTVLSFHPVKHITTGEGGMIVTDDPRLADTLRRFRNHGISTDHRQREEQGTWYYEMQDLGCNYRITDFQCALGISQLRKLPGFLARRREIAGYYDQAFADQGGVRPLAACSDRQHAYHLYVVRLSDAGLRAATFKRLRERGIGVNVHYLPVYLHPFYRERYGHSPGLCPAAEAAYEQIISLPIWPGMDDGQVERVVQEVRLLS